jgi:hypothetical protein
LEEQEQTDADDISSACASLFWEIRNHPTFLPFQAWRDRHLSISPRGQQQNQHPPESFCHRVEPLNFQIG